MNEARERTLAWAGTIVAVVYFVYRGTTIFLAGVRFEIMFDGLGAPLPAATRFALDYRLPIVATLFGLPTVVIIAKEWFIRDKRISMMVTMLIVILVAFGVDILIALYYLPLMDLISRLNS